MAIATPALAQESDASAPDTATTETLPSGGRDYAPDYFARFSPSTAFDMVRRIPGFAIQQGDDERGLGQASQNVLINGQRISGKSNDAVTALSRISASNVVRLEVRDGATLDIPGLSGQVVNVVAETSGLSGNFLWNPEFRTRFTNPRLYTGEISINGNVGPVEYTVSLSNTNDWSFRTADGGPELVFDADGNIIDVRDEVARFSGDRPTLSGSFQIDGPGSSIGNLNLSYERYYYDQSEESFRTGPGQPDRFRLLTGSENEWNYEIGGDFEFALGPGRLKLIGLRSFESSPFVNTLITQFADDSPATGSRFVQQLDESEWIARGEYSWAMEGDWQVALEGALNTLDAASELAVLNDEGDFEPVPLPNANSRVEEERAEVNISYGRPLADNLTLQASLGGEYSKISQTGARGLTRTFYRPKGFVSLAWQPYDSLDIRARIEREVGQLDFSDFIASVNINNENQDVGNPELVPPQTWLYELEATKELGDFGSVTATFFYRDISDIVDQVPIGTLGEAPGNIASAKRYGVEANATINFDPLGWRGARLDVDLTLRETSLIDPLTGESRPISFLNPFILNADFRYDIPTTDWAIGFEWQDFTQDPGFRLTEISKFRTGAAFAGAYVENKDVFGLRVRASVLNLFGQNNNFRRTVFVNRRDGPINFIEDRSREFGPIFSFEIAGSF